MRIGFRSLNNMEVNMILSICDDPKTMEIINIVIKIINVLKIVEIILLIPTNLEINA